ncbi:MAG: hypothetical protein JJU13_08340 [Balneolaceae bacterium]|nr:hypothetical protein [Balneolaceae bacterium]
MNIKELCLELINSESEKKVIKVLEKYSLWDKDDFWIPYDGNENNFSIIGSQQSEPDAALVEKLINSVDALLISECKKNGFEPESPKAPQSIVQAVESFFGVHDGKLSNIDASYRSSISENICLVATGKKTKPCYSVIDKGEGQHPEDIPYTFLSLNKSNKLRIPFVQGKFNMGGTGVLQFCGDKNIQLIVSKKHPDFVNGNGQNYWGLTVVRRDPPPEGTRSSVYNYLAPNNEILKFDSKIIPVLPGKYPDAYKKGLEHGTFIKLYDYDIKGYRTNVVFDLYNRLSLLMPNLALPIRLYERRKGYKGHSFETTLSGLSVRLEEDKRDNLEPNFPSSSKITINEDEIPVTIYAFKKGKSSKYMKSEGIIFSINGQTHGSLSQSFFTRKKVKMGYLSDSILVLVDCTNLDGRHREDLFMNSRDKLRHVNIRNQIERALENLISNHQGLKNLREKRRRDEITDKLEDSKPFVEVLNNIITKSPTLSKLFITGTKISSPINLANKKEDKDYNGKKFPTYFELVKSYSSENPKTCHINKRFRIQYKTDAENDYLTRDNQPGTFSLRSQDREVDTVVNLWNGYANVNISLPKSAKVGDLIEFKSKVDDTSRVMPFEESFFVKVLDKTKTKSNGGGNRKPPTNDDKDGNLKGQNKLALPNVFEIKKDGWGDHQFDEFSALRVVDNGDEGYDFFVNIDNSHLLHEIKNSKLDEIDLMKARYKYALVLMGLSILHDYENDNSFFNEQEGNIYSLIKSFSRTVSPIILPMIDYLGDLEVDEVPVL